MRVLVKDLSKEHPAVRASHMMVEAHGRHETLLPAVEEVQEEFPELEPEQLVLIWIGINAKDREGLDA